MSSMVELPDAVEAVETAAAWAAKGEHWCVCPSGAKVKIRIPSLADLVKRDAIPTTLKLAAERELNRQENDATVEALLAQTQMTTDEVKSLYDLYEALVAEMVICPKLKPPVWEDDPANPDGDPIVIDRGDVPSLPEEDKQLLIAIATRQTDVDALGVRLGVEPLNRWARFRDEHECPEGCDGCARALRRLSGSAVYGG